MGARIHQPPGEELLGRVLARAFARPAEEIRVLGRQRLKSSVHRLRLGLAEGPRSVIVKRLAPESARANALVAQRWLPAVGLQRAAPEVLGVVAEPDLDSAWLVCADLGGRTLAEERSCAATRAALALIAELHRSFADHALLGEVRHWGGDLGPPFLVGNLRDAVRALEGLAGPAAEAAHAALCERLLSRLEGLLADAPRRAALLERCGGPETLLHGDLWLENLLVLPGPGGCELCLIDWDHAAVGPPVYDVSTFLLRFPPPERRGLWEAYRAELGPRAWRMPADGELDLLCRTAEQARIANRVIWPALAARRGERDWAFEELAMIEGWFEALGPVLS